MSLNWLSIKVFSKGYKFNDCKKNNSRGTLQNTHVYEVALGGSVRETGIRWDIDTFPLGDIHKHSDLDINNTYRHALVGT